MCLEAQDPNPQQDGGGDLNVCVGNDSLTKPILFEIVHGDFEDEKSRKVRRREEQFSVIGADFTFGLSRSRFQSPMTVTACHSRNSLSRPNAAQGSTQTNFQEQMGGSPKFLNSIWQGKPACWETTGVQPRLPGSQLTT